MLLTLLKEMDASRTMVFVNTRREADRLGRFLAHNGVNARAISGDVPQKKRLRMFGDFLSGKLAVLIGTDVASRGLHVPDVSHVFNFDLPQDAEDYVHRIGRTARAGASGDAISFGCESYAASLPDIEALIGRKIPVERIDPEALVTVMKPPYRPASSAARAWREAFPQGGRHRQAAQEALSPGSKFAAGAITPNLSGGLRNCRAPQRPVVCLPSWGSAVRGHRLPTDSRLFVGAGAASRGTEWLRWPPGRTLLRLQAPSDCPR